MSGARIVLSRDALVEFLGEVALPPGSGAPPDTDCAPIADRIREWLDEHADPTPTPVALFARFVRQNPGIAPDDPLLERVLAAYGHALEETS